MATSIRQAGALAIRTEKGVTKIALVRARKDPAHWIFPKGHIEPGESAAAAAARELLEEAGIEGTVIRRAGECSHRREGITYRVDYYLLRYRATRHAGESGREMRWCTIHGALELLTFANTRRILRAMSPAIRSLRSRA